MSLVIFLFIFTLLALAHSKSLVLPITKDQSTLQYTTTIYLKTPPKAAKVLLDLGATFSWVNCESHYISTTYKHIPCNSSLCTTSLHSLACSNCYNAPGPSCANDTCALFPENPVTRKAGISNALIDVLGLERGQPRIVPEFIFSCSEKFLFKGLAKGLSGSAGFGRSGFSLPAQVSKTLSMPFCFALCLSGSTTVPGVGFFGPYSSNFYPGNDLSKSLIYTPLLLNPVGSTIITYSRQPSDEYYIGLTSIKVNGKSVDFNETILTINEENGFGGTKISTVTPYTVLQSSIYGAFIKAFERASAALNLTVTTPVAPFDVCYLAAGVYLTRVGPAVPTVDFIMHSKDVFWRLFGSNSMVKIESKDVWCLGFLDGGANARAGVVIGGHQMEDNLLQFDVELKRFGFTSSILGQGTSCANFNFTKHA